MLLSTETTNSKGLLQKEDCRHGKYTTIKWINSKLNSNPTGESGYMNSRNMLTTRNSLTKGSRSHRNGNNTINRRLMLTGQSMLNSSSSTISSVSNNIERDRDSKDFSSRKMTDEPRYYVMESGMSLSLFTNQYFIYQFIFCYFLKSTVG